ncbi:MAG: hypothetical protein WBD87_06415 [Candidatus Acidiferrales bacterium]
MMKYLERFLRYIFWAVVTAAIAWFVKKAFQRAAEERRPGAGPYAVGLSQSRRR